MIRALLIDLDGVLRHWPADDEPIERAHALPPGALRAAAFAEPLLAPATLGRVTDAVWREGIVSALAERYPEARSRAAVAAWSLGHGELDRQVLALVDEHLAGIRLVLASNATSRLARDLEALGIGGRFHAVVNSSDIGVRKPAMKFFHLALRAAGVVAEEALYVDDGARNVEAALALGITSHVYGGHEGLAEFLRESAADDGD